MIAFNALLHEMVKKAVTRFRAENIGFIFQQYNLIPTLNCIEKLSVLLRIQGAAASEEIPVSSISTLLPSHLYSVRTGGEGRNRTDECSFCRAVPYHLATPPKGLANIFNHPSNASF